MLANGHGASAPIDQPPEEGLSVPGRYQHDRDRSWPSFSPGPSRVQLAGPCAA